MLAAPDWTRAIDDVLEAWPGPRGAPGLPSRPTSSWASVGEPPQRWVAPGRAAVTTRLPADNRPAPVRPRRSLDAGRALVLRTSEIGPPLRQWFTDLGTSSILVVPIIVDGVRRGVIGFDDASTTRKWGDADVASLSAAAGAIGAAIRHRRALDSMHSRDAILEAVTFAAEQFMVASSLDEVIDEILARLGGAARASRVALIARSEADGSGRMGIRAEWTAPGVARLLPSAEPGGFRYFPAGRRHSATASSSRPGERLTGRRADPPRGRPRPVAPPRPDRRLRHMVGPRRVRRHQARSGLVRSGDRGRAGGRRHHRRRDRSRPGPGAPGRRPADGGGREPAGGLAHDFGNVLTAVIGNAELLVPGPARRRPRRRRCDHRGRRPGIPLRSATS